MVDHNVLSLPVLNQKGKYYGIIEMFDLVEYVTALFSDLGAMKLIDLEKLLNSEKTFVSATVRDVLKRPLSSRNPFRPINRGFSLFTAWEILGLGGVNRIPITNENGEICDIITQSMLVDFLWQNIEKIGAVAETKISDFKGAESEEVSSIPPTTKAINAFREMVRTEKAGLAVVDENGKLLDNMSVRDLRGIHTDAQVFWRLWSPVNEYKEMARKEFPDKTPAALVFVLPTDSLFTVVEKMAKLHIHRIYVVDSAESLTPLRVITQTDLLKEVLLNQK
uniref:CBS domain-containing protein n=1 Tax=Arcella intermedia TaxID=1963864 RepID=A0A6B2LDC7_9EUKA